MIQPSSPLEQAFVAYQNRDLRSARKFGEEALEREPRNLQALHLLSMVASALGDHPGHLDLLQRILIVAPNHPPSLCALANLKREQGNPAEGEQLAQRAIDRAPNYAGAHNALGLCLQQLERHEEAAERFRHAVRLDPNSGVLYLNLGSALHHLGRWEEALEAYRTAERLSPNVPEIYEGMAKLYGAQKRRFEAIEKFEKALLLSSNSTSRMLQLAEVKAMVGDTEESVELVARALELDSTLPEAHYQHGLRLQEQGKFEQAKAAFEKSIRLRPQQGEAYYGLVTNQRITETDGAILQTIRSLIVAAQLPVDQLELLHTALGKAYDDLGEFKQAVQHVEEANRLESSKDGGKSKFDPREFERYVDRIIAEFSSEFFTTRADWSLDSELPIFIIGLPRSGTTLTEQILACHPEVETAGEQVFWTEADSDKGIVSLGENKELSRGLGQSYLQSLRKFGPQARFVTDKRPDNFLFVGLLHILFPGAKIVHCTRDILDNAVSLYMTPYRSRPPFTQTGEGIVAYIEQYRRLMDHWNRVLPPGTLLGVSYEEIVSNQQATTQELLSFCDLPWNEACLRPEKNKRSVSTPSNWQTRQSVYRSSMQRWRNYEELLGPMIRLLK